MNILIFADKIKTTLYEKFKGTFLCAILFFASQIAYAATVSLSQSEILNFEQINTSSPGGYSFITGIPQDGVTFLTYFVLESGPNSADIGDDEAGFNWDEFDTYSQSILNRDENPWYFSLSVKDTTNLIASSSSYELQTNEEKIFSVDLSQLNSRNPIDAVWVTVSGNIPEPGNDAVLEWDLYFEMGEVNEIPIPGSIIFILSALSSLLLFKRRH